MKSVLNYFVRKAFGFKSTATAEDKTLFGHLLRIRQNIQGVYDWLYGKVCGSADGTIPRYMPMTEAVTDPNDGHEVRIAKAWNSDTLLAHLRLLDGRKISNGYQDGTPADDGLPDGVSLARILCDSSLQPTELVDDNIGWVCDKNHNFGNSYNNRMVLNCVEMICKVSSDNDALLMNVGAEVVEFPYAKRITRVSPYHCIVIWGNGVKTISMPALEYGELLNNTDCGAFRGENLEEILLPSIKEIPLQAQYSFCTPSPKLRKVVFGSMTSFPNGIRFNRRQLTGKEDSCPNLIHLEFGEGTACNIGLQNWLAGWDEPLALSTTDSSLADGMANNLARFLSNFLHFIAERVADRTGKSSLTLTLSAAVFSAIWDADGNPAVVGDGYDDLRAAINTELRYNKKWNVNKA